MVLQVVIDQQRNLVRSKQEELERVRREKEEAEKRLSASEAMVTTLVQEKDRHYHSMRQAEAKGQGLTELQVGCERGRPGMMDLSENLTECCGSVTWYRA
jgi:predicted  nucleic acid-binding Zn-ribbon protein